MGLTNVLIINSRIAVLYVHYVDEVYCNRPSSVVCRSVTVVSPAKTAEPIEMPFGLRTRVGSRNHVVEGAQFPVGKSNFEGRRDGQL